MKSQDRHLVVRLCALSAGWVHKLSYDKSTRFPSLSLPFPSRCFLFFFAFSSPPSYPSLPTPPKNPPSTLSTHSLSPKTRSSVFKLKFHLFDLVRIFYSVMYNKCTTNATLEFGLKARAGPVNWPTNERVIYKLPK